MLSRIRNYALSTLMGLAGASLVACSDEYNFQGRIASENLFEPAPGFGLVYRIEVSSRGNEKTKPFVVVGNEQELRKLDKEYHVGDLVKIRNNQLAFTADLESTIAPEDIKKQ